MPYFKWCGVDMLGNNKTGTLSARSEKHLDTLLFNQGISVFKSNITFINPFFRSIQLPIQIQFFQQLLVLIKSGILLPEALDIVVQQLHHPVCQEIMYNISDAVSTGTSFTNALQQYAFFLNPLVFQMIQIGQETGNISEALDAVCEYLQMRYENRTKIRSLLCMPLATGLFLVGVAIIIFVVIIPRFVDLFLSLHTQVPPITQRMLSVSRFFTSWYFVLLIVGLFVMYRLIKKWCRTGYGKKIKDFLCLRLPCIGIIIQQQLCAYILQSISLLHNSGMQLVSALQVIANSIDNSVVKKQLLFIQQEVAAGSCLSDAMYACPDSIFTNDIIAMVRIGEDSGAVTALLKETAQVYNRKSTNTLHHFTLLLQPVLIIVLGLLIVMLICALYIPIISISQAL